MADFDTAVSKLLRIEGGYRKHDNRNGAVNFGITQKFLNSIGYAKSARDLTTEEAVEIYRHWFWKQFRIGEIENQELAERFFFSVVNTAPQYPIRFLQYAANAKPDGIMGSRTIEAVNAGDAEQILETFRQQMIERYTALAQSDPIYARDLAGWHDRLYASY